MIGTSLWCAIDSKRETVSSSLPVELADQLPKLILPTSASRARHMLGLLERAIEEAVQLYLHLRIALDFC